MFSATLVLVALMGLALGSFLNVVISRLPRDEPVWAGRSHCPLCRTTLPWYDNLPLLSFCLLKGRCRFCGAPISWRYPAVELAGAGLALALWLRFPGSPLLWVYGPFSALLVALTGLDLEHRWLPDVLTLPGIVLGLALSLFFPHLSFTDALAGAAAGWLIFFLLAWIYERLAGRKGLGGGDVKLLALIGAFLGVESLPWVILISATLGSLAGLVVVLAGGLWRGGHWRHIALPYGPFLASAALIYLLANVEF